MTYQDQWAHGKLISKGYRECENRYSIIKSFCANKFKHGFSVCDIGANMCYFGIRLVEDFKCNVIAFEFHHHLMRSSHLSISGASNNIVFLDRKVNLRDLRVFNACMHFDLVLALSVLHHVKEDQLQWERELMRLGNFIIVEYAAEDSERAIEKHNYGFKGNGILLGYGDSHLDKSKQRQIVAIKGGDNVE